MRTSVGFLVVIAACGGKQAGGTIGNETARADGGLVKPATADCPEGVLGALAPGWEGEDSGGYDLENEGLTPQLDACARGNLIGESVVVYASAQPEPDSQSEIGFPARRVIVGLDGTLLAEGPRGGGDWMVDAAS